MTLQAQRNLGKFAARGDAAGVEAALRDGANPNLGNSNGATVLLRAVLGTFNLKVLQLLLAAGADPSRTNRNSETPLMMAVGMGRGIEAVKALLAAGADVAAVDANGFTVLHYAVMDADGAGTQPEPLESVRLLLAAGAPVDGGAATEGSALELACRRGCKEICVALLEAGARVDDRMRSDSFWQEVRDSRIPRAANNAEVIRRLVESLVMSRAIGSAMGDRDGDLGSRPGSLKDSGPTL